MSIRPLPPIEYLNEALEICNDSPTGLKWRNRPKSHFRTNKGWKTSNTRDAGNNAGSKKMSGDGVESYSVKLNQLVFPAHRIIFALYSQRDPWPLEVDHIDRCATNNHPDNLRVATRNENARNRSVQSNNRSGYRGVTFCKRTGKWMAQIGHNGKCLFLGRFTNAEEAADARSKKEKEIHAEFSPMHMEATR